MAAHCRSDVKHLSSMIASCLLYGGMSVHSDLSSTGVCRIAMQRQLCYSIDWLIDLESVRGLAKTHQTGLDLPSQYLICTIEGLQGFQNGRLNAIVCEPVSGAQEVSTITNIVEMRTCFEMACLMSFSRK